MLVVEKNKRCICIAGSHFVSERQGGVELQTRYLGQILAQSGWRVVFLSPTLKGKMGIERVDSNTEVWWLRSQSYGFQYMARNLEDILNRMGASVFYMRGRGHLQESRVVLRYAKRKAIPFVFALSSDADLGFFTGARGILESSKPIWKKIALLPYAIWSDCILRHTMLQADYLVSQHEIQSNQIRRKLHRDSHILRTTHQELGRKVKKSEKQIVVWVTNYRPWKQGELFIQLAERLRELDVAFYMIYGRTKEQYIEPILGQARQLGNIRLFGECDTDEVEKRIEEASLFVNTSLPYEGFPNTFVQAWLRETPVVSLQVDPGGVLCREKIGICSGSFEQMVDDVSSLILNEKTRITMGEKARAYAEKIHGLQHNASRIVQFFDKVITANEHISKLQN